MTTSAQFVTSDRIQVISSRYAIVRGRHGQMLANQNDFYMGRGLMAYGEVNQFEVLMLRRLLVQPGIFVDVGANMGLHTVPIARFLRQTKSRMIAVEPQTELCWQLRTNLQLGSIANVTVFNCACGDDSSEVVYRLPDYDCLGNFGGVSMVAAVENVEYQKVSCAPLDDLLLDETVGVLKIDVEGWECAVLKGSDRLLARCRPLLYVENDRREHSDHLIEWLWERGYELWWHSSLLFNPMNYFGTKVNLFPGVCSKNMIGIPRESQIRRPSQLPKVVLRAEEF